VWDRAAAPCGPLIGTHEEIEAYQQARRETEESFLDFIGVCVREWQLLTDQKGDAAL